MRAALIICVFAGAFSAVGQNATELIAIESDTVIGTVNGAKLTAGEFERMLQKLDANSYNLAAFEPARFLEQHALARTLEGEARAAGLDKRDPYRKQIEDYIRQALMNAAIAEKSSSSTIPEDELRKIYTSRIADYKQASVKVIFVSRATYEESLATGAKKQTSPEQARDKAATVAKMARQGKDFAELAKQYSDDPSTSAKGADFPFPIRSTSQNVPGNMRTAVLAAKVGDIVGPIEDATGYYLFRVESSGTAEFAAVRQAIETEVRSAKVAAWIEEMRKKSVVTLDHRPFWDTFVAANRAARDRQQKSTGAGAGGTK